MLVFRTERANLRFSGTGAGPVAFARRRERVAAGPQLAEAAGGVAAVVRRAGAVDGLCHALYFGLFVRNEVNPE